MLTAFIYGALVGAVVGWAGWLAWRRLPAPLAGLAALAGAAAVIAAITGAARVGVHLSGTGQVASLVIGLVAGGQLADLAPSRRATSAAAQR
jgi:NhaP-type Na+/H+ or K+/H+ antiporter